MIKARCDHRKAETYSDSHLTDTHLFARQTRYRLFVDRLIELSRGKLNLAVQRRRNISENAVDVDFN